MIEGMGATLASLTIPVKTESLTLLLMTQCGEGKKEVRTVTRYIIGRENSFVTPPPLFYLTSITGIFGRLGGLTHGTFSFNRIPFARRHENSVPTDSGWKSTA